MQLDESKIAEEMSKMEYEPLQPVEMKLIGWSLGLGTFLLVALYFVADIFFPGAHA